LKKFLDRWGGKTWETDEKGGKKRGKGGKNVGKAALPFIVKT